MEKHPQQEQRADERLRIELLISGLSDWVSLAEVYQIVSHFHLAETESERQDLIVRTVRSLLEDGLMQVGELPGPDGAFAAWEPIGIAMARLGERFIDNYSERESWDYSIWLSLSDAGLPLAKKLRNNE